MKTQVLSALFVLSLALPGAMKAQVDLSRATYIGVEQWRDTVNALPGVDRQIVSQDIGDLNLSVGIIHRNATAPAGGRGRGGRGGGGGPPTTACGVSSGEPSGARGIQHVHQTETYIIVSGAGTLVTGGSILDGTASGPESVVTTTLNGPSCSGDIVGDVQIRDVVVGDIVIIPAGVPHGWLNIPRHVDYLSVRPDPDRVLPSDYVHPSITVYR
jgi:mannose-6-phosphate isomerase-like protein (cupin superfamily)